MKIDNAPEISRYKYKNYTIRLGVYRQVANITSADDLCLEYWFEVDKGKHKMIYASELPFDDIMTALESAIESINEDLEESK